MSDQFDDLKRLAELRDRGDIDQAEYEKLKAQLLTEIEDAPSGESILKTASPSSTQSGGPSPTSPMQNRTRWYLIGAGVLMAVGSFLPWAQAGIFSVAGTDGDGIFTLIGGVVVALVGVANREGVVTGLGTAIVGGFSLWIVFNVFGNVGIGDYDLIGSGVYLTLLASFVATIAGIQLALEARKSSS